MPWYDKFLGRKTHIMKPSGGMLYAPRSGPPVMWVPGKWVVWNGRVGILTKFIDHSLVEVMLTTPQGTDEQAVRVPAADISIARLEDIPHPRRPIDADVARRLGYI